MLPKVRDIIKLAYICNAVRSSTKINKVIDVQNDLHFTDSVFVDPINFPDQTNEQRFYISPIFMRRATLVYGEMPTHINNAILNQTCLNIAFIGGSNSCGRVCCNEDKIKIDSPQPLTNDPWDQYSGKPNAFPAVFEHYINSHWPCISLSRHTNSHNITNLCQPAVGSDIWINNIVTSWHTGNDLDSSLNNADIIIVETSVNDGNNGGANPMNNDAVPGFTELLIKLLTKLGRSPAIIYLGVMTRGGNMPWNGDLPRLTDAVHLHLNVTSYYNIPHLSLIDGLGPFLTEEDRSFFTNVLRIDCCHLSKTGHKIVALMLFRYLFNYYQDLKYPMYPNFGALSHFYANLNKPLIHIGQQQLEEAIGGEPLDIKFNDGSAKKYINYQSDGWAINADVPGKYGLIAHSVDEYLILTVSAEEVSKHLKFGGVSVVLLKSYENMGVLNVTVSRIVATPETGYFSTSGLIDCLWEDHSSQQTVYTLKVDPTAANSNVFNRRKIPLTIEFRIIESGRKHNKVKLISMSID